MFIQTEATPNPLTLKFIPGRVVLAFGSRQYENVEQASDSPLARALFSIPGVAAIFFGTDFISVTKQESAEWPLLKTEILTTIMEHFTAGAPVVEGADRKEEDSTQDADPIVREIKSLIETRIRPAVAQDGGDIVFHAFEEGIVKVELHGACSGCPSSTMTLKQGIERMLKHYVPEVIAVEAV